MPFTHNSQVAEQTTDSPEFDEAGGEGLSLNPEIPAEVPDWVMVARTGSWLGHPRGPEVVTKEHLKSALAAFDRNYAENGTDLAIDYHHSSVFAAQGQMSKAPAAGWIREMELRNDGTELWAHVLWTAEARSDIADRRYRYLSPVLRWNEPDPVTGERVPLQIHSVALTNTPFMTSLQALNQASAPEGPDKEEKPKGSEKPASLLVRLAELLDFTPDEVASRLGLEAPNVDDSTVARAVMKTAETEDSVPGGVANALGLDAGADERSVKAAILRLRAPGAGLEGVRRALGLSDKADEKTILNAIQDLQQDHHNREAEELVDRAVEEGRIPPAHREFFLNNALEDYEATRMCLDNMPPVISPSTHSAGDPEPGRELSDSERQVCNQLGLAPDAYLNAAQKQQ
mgnify:CR=1 FL=1